MALGNNNISVTAVKNEMGASENNVSGLCKNTAQQNKYSIYRGGRIRSNSTTKYMEIYDPTSDYKLGDFRSYDQLQTQPTPFEDVTVLWGPTNPVTIDAQSVLHPTGHIHLKEMADYHGTLSTWTYWVVEAYTSSANRAARTSKVYTRTFLIDWDTLTPPTGHTVDVTILKQKPTNYQIETFTGISTGYTKLYLETSIGNIDGSSIGVRLEDGYSEITINSQDWSTISGGDINPTGTGYAVAYRNDASGGCAGNETIDLTSVGTGKTISGYATPMNYSTGSRMTCTGNVDLWLVKDGVDQVLVSSGSLTGTYRFFSTSGHTIGYDEVWTIDLRKTSGSWVEISC